MSRQEVKRYLSEIAQNKRYYMVDLQFSTLSEEEYESLVDFLAAYEPRSAEDVACALREIYIDSIDPDLEDRHLYTLPCGNRAIYLA